MSIPPGPRQIVSSLLAGLAFDGSQEPSRRPEAPLAASTKDIFLTLHVLFPHHLLDALDLLDRGLVIRLRSPQHAPGRRLIADYHVRSAQVPSASSSWRDRGRGTGGEHDGGIEASMESHHVRLAAWHCSCPGFAYSAFAQSLHLDEESEDVAAHMAPVEAAMGSLQESPHTTEPTDDWASLPFGGVFNSGTRQGQGINGTRLSESGMPPICKHLFACLLAERCGNIFNGSSDKETTHSTVGMGRGCRERCVTDYEAAGWAAAGWHV